MTGNKTKALEAFNKAHECDPNVYRSNVDGALNGAATAVYKKVFEDKEFVAKLPQ